MPTKTTTHTHVSSSGTVHTAKFVNGNGHHTASFSNTKTTASGCKNTKTVTFKK